MEPTNPVEFIEKMQEILASPDNWCQGPEAMDIDGNDVRATDDNAVRFCLLGSRNRASKLDPWADLRYQAWDIVNEVAREDYNFDDAVAFNEEPGRTHAEVVQFLAKARARAQAYAEDALSVQATV
jgi:hypothetical protein